MVSNPEGFTDNIIITPNQYEPTKKPSTIKSLRKFSESLDVTHKTDVRGLGTDKKSLNSIIQENGLCTNISNRHDHTKINQEVKKSL